jgi:hypothetical protein
VRSGGIKGEASLPLGYKSPGIKHLFGGAYDAAIIKQRSISSAISLNPSFFCFYYASSVVACILKKDYEKAGCTFDILHCNNCMPERKK